MQKKNAQQAREAGWEVIDERWDLQLLSLEQSCICTTRRNKYVRVLMFFFIIPFQKKKKANEVQGPSL